MALPNRWRQFLPNYRPDSADQHEANWREQDRCFNALPIFEPHARIVYQSGPGASTQTPTVGAYTSWATLSQALPRVSHRKQSELTKVRFNVTLSMFFTVNPGTPLSFWARDLNGLDYFIGKQAPYSVGIHANMKLSSPLYLTPPGIRRWEFGYSVSVASTLGMDDNDLLDFEVAEVLDPLAEYET